MMDGKLSVGLTRQQILWLKDLILADIHDWECMSARPVGEVGLLFARLAENRISNMELLLSKLNEL